MSEPVSFGIRIPPCGRIDEVAAVVGAAEVAGFDVAWLPDSQLLWRDVWATLAVAATTTDRIRLGTCVTNVETRHPTVTAAAAATIAELAPNRFILGIGTGDSSAKTIGLRPTRIARMREQLVLLRTLLDGGSVPGADGRTVRLMSVPGRPVPIYLAVGGPRITALAGELCDGAIGSGVAPEDIASTRARVSEAAKAAGRSASAMDLCVTAICHTTDDPRAAARLVKPYVVATAQLGGRSGLRDRFGIDIDPPQHVPGVHPDMSHAQDWDAAVAAAGRWVSDADAARVAEADFLIGDADHLIARFEAAVAAGARSFYVRHLESYTFPTALIEAFGKTVIPHFRPTTVVRTR